MATPTHTAQQALDAQIALQECEIVALKRRRNALSPVSAIPPEILCDILLLATSHPRWDDRDIDDMNNLPGMLRVKGYMKTLCGVSHSWRTLALACPELWAEIDIRVTTAESQVEFAVKHAHPHAISLCIDSTVPALQNNSWNNLKVFSTTKRILLETENLDKLAFKGSLGSLADILPCCRPTVRSLQIAVLDRHGRSSTDAGAVIAQCPLFAHPVSGLRTLVLMGCSIPLTCPVLFHSPHLTRLSLSIPSGSSASHILGVLRNTPQLHQLYLKFRHSLHPSGDPITPAHLPHLSQVALKGRSGSISATLSQLRMSRTVLQLNFVCEVTSRDDLRRAGEDLFNALRQARSSPQHTTSADHQSNQAFAPDLLGFGCAPSGSVYQNTIGNWDQKMMTLMYVVFGREGTSSFIDWTEWHPLVMASDPQEVQQRIGWSLDQLELVAGDCLAPLRGLLSKCPMINDLDISPSQALGLLPFLSTDTGMFPFPSLLRIQVTGSSTTQDYDELFEAFVQALTRRRSLSRKYGTGHEWELESLTLTDCISPPSDQWVHAVKSQGLIEHVILE